MSMSNCDGETGMGGQLVEWRDAKIDVLSDTIHCGCGAFEGVCADNAVGGIAPFRLQEHTDRLLNGAKVARMKIPVTRVRSMNAQRKPVRISRAREWQLARHKSP